MYIIQLRYLSFFFGLISILSFFNIIYSYYLNLYLNLDTYYYCLLFNECGKFENIKVPEDHFLVLGDNRSNSWDGRYWPGSKFLHKKEIIGKAYFRFWPLSQVGFFQ